MTRVGYIDLEDLVRAQRSTVLFGVLAVGLVLTQQACTPKEAPQSGSPAPSATSAAAAAPGEDANSGAGTTVKGTTAKGTTAKGTTSSGGGKTTATGVSAKAILAGQRQIVIKPAQAFESILAVDSHGRLNPTDGEAERGLFVLTPVRDKYLIKTAKADAGGEPSCMDVKLSSSRTLTVVAAACDTSRAGQLFTITAQKGHPTYTIVNQGAFLQVFEHYGLIAQELGDALLTPTFEFVDNGPAALPVLD